MGYGRNALWLAEQGYEVEGWETDRRYLAEARREARRRGLRLTLRRADFSRVRFRGPYDAIVISNALHQVRRSAALRTLRQASQALAPGGQLFLLVKLTRDPHFQRLKSNLAWQAVRGERNTFRHRGRGWVLSALTRAEVKSALRGLRVRQYREGVYRSRWPEPGGAGEPGAVRHHLAEVAARKPTGRGENRGNE